MDRLQRFHRRKKDLPSPTIITNDLPTKTTPQGDRPTTDSPMRSSLRGLSPFRRFHRSSGKRARDSPPASLPHSPAVAPGPTVDGADGRPVSPLSLKMDHSEGQKLSPRKRVKMPAFLEQSPQEIENKFSELVWRERNRVMQSLSNPSPDFRWARVSGPHLRRLDRYMNIQPWHNNRVKLRVPDGHVDYVNASPIVLAPLPGGAGEREPDRYIAMQGPKRASTDHVWRMVVEQLESPAVIVMLTETHEGNVEKCHPPVLHMLGQGEDLIFETVDRLREQRRMMVQAESQYHFIYQVMRKLWIDKYGRGSDGGESDGEPAAKRLEVDPFIEK
ncbi:tyrosine protein phosphatase 1 [Collariella sp. IMI 366227]|nr:tyrosine protein phosphatase 1 [Collariella sp. IMI 366227]